jgi:hypothetical protein
MTERGRIEADLDGVRVSPDGTRLTLLLRDTAGQKFSLSLPMGCLNAVLAAAPQPAEPGNVHSVETWNMALAGNGQDMMLTLCTAEGMMISFAIKPWQVQGMATIATYGATREGTSRSVH